MASARAHIRIARSADDVWKVAGDPDSITGWMPGIESSSTDASGLRTVGLPGGRTITEQVHTKDDALRRLQYGIIDSPLPVTYHRATLDVIGDGDGAFVVYAVDVEPADLKPMFDQVAAGTVQGLAAHLA